MGGGRLWPAKYLPLAAVSYLILGCQSQRGPEAGRRFNFLIFLCREGARRRVDSHRNRHEKRLCLLLGGELGDVNSVG